MSEGVALDTTLTQSGQAADAKAVGDALAGKQPSGSYLKNDELAGAIDDALAQAKASGEFDGHTPVKGMDYWTASDKAEVVAEAAAAIDLTSYAKKTEVPTKTSQLTNDSGFLTSHQDISGKQDKSTLEADVAAKGFTKNTGTYSKPAGGIPKSDLAAAVQTSLGKADTALQEHQSLAAYRTATAQDAIDSGKQDKITSTNKLAYSLISGTPTIPTVPTNVSAFTNDEGYLTLATLPKYEGVVE